MKVTEIVLVHSRQDPAGRNIHHRVREILEREAISRHDVVFRLETVEDRLIRQEGIDRRTGGDLIVFLSRHTGTHPFPLLSVHVTGNLARAELGGAPFSFAPAAPEWMKAVLQNLAVRAPPGFRVTYEVTHHGPTDLSVPSFFVEIGSTEEEWVNEQAGRAVAESVLHAVPREVLPLLGLGGNHYAARATDLALSSEAAFGHIIHSRMVRELDASLLMRLREKSRAVAAHVDRKALSASDLDRIEDLAREIDLPLVGESEVREISRVGWELFRNLRSCARHLEPGGRMVTGNLRGEGILGRIAIDPRLVQEAERSDGEALRQGLRALPVVYLVGPSGRILPRFITFESLQSELIHELIRLCVKTIIENNNTSIDGDTLILRTLRFDPNQARALGIPVGPLFGRLSAGQAIEVGGRRVTPDMVQKETIKILQIPGLERYV